MLRKQLKSFPIQLKKNDFTYKQLDHLNFAMELGKG